jgi:hypothetical protein
MDLMETSESKPKKVVLSNIMEVLMKTKWPLVQKAWSKILTEMWSV